MRKDAGKTVLRNLYVTVRYFERNVIEARERSDHPLGGKKRDRSPRDLVLPRDDRPRGDVLLQLDRQPASDALDHAGGPALAPQLGITVVAVGVPHILRFDVLPQEPSFGHQYPGRLHAADEFVAREDNRVLVHRGLPDPGEVWIHVDLDIRRWKKHGNNNDHWSPRRAFYPEPPIICPLRNALT